MKALYEVVALRPATQLAPDMPGTILQIAADRWLILDNEPSVPANFAVSEVTGKWRKIHLEKPQVLASSVDFERLLADRSCARTGLFDCPAIILKSDAGYAVWIERSYEHAFSVAVQQAGT